MRSIHKLKETLIAGSDIAKENHKLIKLNENTFYISPSFNEEVR